MEIEYRNSQIFQSEELKNLFFGQEVKYEKLCAGLCEREEY
jgi:hypothetical protein